MRTKVCRRESLREHGNAVCLPRQRMISLTKEHFLRNKEPATKLGSERRLNRQRLLDVAVEMFPIEPQHAYGENSALYQSFVEFGSIDELQPMFVARMGRYIRAWRKMVDELLKQKGQSLHRWQTLFEIAVNPPGETLTSISQRLGLMGATLVRLLDELEQDGLIERTVDQTDRRSKLIKLTSAGEETVAWMYSFVMKLRRQFLDGISEGELKIMIDAAAIMKENLENMGRSVGKTML
jgi:MarR family transcriptional regulator, transcriptional regulator for hemolysin